MTDTHTNAIDGVVQISRSPREVFEYVADPVRLPEWQPDVVRAAFDDPAVVGVGSVGREIRHIMGSDRPVSWKVTDYSPDHRFALSGIDGPVRARVTMEVSPITGGTGARLHYAVDLEGRGIGRLIVGSSPLSVG